MKKPGAFTRIAGWAAAGLWAGLIFFLSSQTAMPVEPPFAGFDKFVHAFEYGVLCILLARALNPGEMARIPASIWVIAITTSLLYGITDELHQAYVPNRSCDAFDALADLAGAGMAALGSIFLSRLRRAYPTGRTSRRS